MRTPRSFMMCEPRSHDRRQCLAHRWWRRWWNWRARMDGVRDVSALAATRRAWRASEGGCRIYARLSMRVSAINSTAPMNDTAIEPMMPPPGKTPAALNNQPPITPPSGPRMMSIRTPHFTALHHLSGKPACNEPGENRGHAFAPLLVWKTCRESHQAAINRARAVPR